MNWKVADAAPYRLLNEVLWKDAKGPHSKMPKPRVSKLVTLLTRTRRASPGMMATMTERVS